MTNEHAIEIMKAYRDRLTSSCSNQLDSDIEAYDLAIKALNTQESLEKKIEFLMNERPQAEWLYFEGVSTNGYLECSKCGETDFHKRYSNFCPNCGKYMKNRKGGAE